MVSLLPDRPDPYPDADEHSLGDFAGVPLVPSNASAHRAIVVGSPLYVFADDGDVRVEQRRIQVYSLWVRGESIHSICHQLGHAYPTVRSDIDIVTTFLRSVRNSDTKGAQDRSIAHLRALQSKCYTMMDDIAHIRQVGVLLNTIVRCEEQIAKIEGLIIQRSHQITDENRRLMLYDFRDVLPPPQSPSADGGDGASALPVDAGIPRVNTDGVAGGTEPPPSVEDQSSSGGS